MAGHLLDESAQGVYIIAATPFDYEGALDLESLDRLIGFYIEAGVHGITILGMMGEAQKLTFDEQRLVIDRVLKQVAGEIPVVVGVSAPGLKSVGALAEEAMSEGGAGVMIAPPPGLSTDEQIEGYVSQAVDAVGYDVPVVLQDYPQATSVHLSVPLVNRLIEALPQIKVLKHEDCPGLAKISRIRKTAARDGSRRIAILVGNGGLYFPLELARGADGAMTGFAFPELLVEVYARFREGDVDEAFDLFDDYLPLIRYEQQPGIGLAIRKQVLHRRGVIKSPALRAPGPKLDTDDLAELDRLLRRVRERGGSPGGW
ncbi:MAG: dihydrodipicolinate synthase family protein [Alphaproteobacteria bacterium]